MFANEEKRDFLPRSLPMSHKLELGIYLNLPEQICPWEFTLIKDLNVLPYPAAEVDGRPEQGQQLWR